MLTNVADLFPAFQMDLYSQPRSGHVNVQVTEQEADYDRQENDESENCEAPLA